MAKEKNKIKVNKGNSKAAPSSIPKNSFITGQLKPYWHVLVVAAIITITWLFLNVCLDNQVTTWDDVPYIRDNRLVKDISYEGLKNIFTTPSMGNYHPFTILSYAIEYSYVQLEPWLYHFDSLMLHILCTVLVYWLVFLLTRKPVAAIVTALLFGLHPMHIESVAWVAARKDVLYGTFYLASCIFYVYYLRTAHTKKRIFYLTVLALFICALLSKPVAVTLPLTLLLIDYFENRTWNKELLIEKIPHFIFALVIGIIAMKVQHTAGAMDMNKVTYNNIERIALGGYALVTYLWKAAVPANLHCLYSYPEKTGGSIPYLYFLYPLVVAAFIFLVWKYARKNKIVMFGMLFFIVNIVLLLQFIPVGVAIVAERYSYMPYLGLFFIGGKYISRYFEADVNIKLRYGALCLTIVYIGSLGYIGNERCKVWYDDISLWRNEIEREPQQAIQAYSNLGYIYYGKWAITGNPDEKQNYYDSAYYLMNKAITLKPDFVNSYIGLGEMQRSAGRFDEAKKTYYSGISIKPKETDLYVGLAILYIVMKNQDSAGYYFRKVLQLNPNAEAHGNYANYLELNEKNDSALVEYNHAVALSKDNYILFMNRGKLFKKLNRLDDALKDFEKAMKMNPDNGELYYLRSFCDTQKRNNALAMQDVEKAIALGYNKVDSAYYSLLKQTTKQ